MSNLNNFTEQGFVSKAHSYGETLEILRPKFHYMLTLRSSALLHYAHLLLKPLRSSKVLPQCPYVFFYESHCDYSAVQCCLHSLCNNKTSDSQTRSRNHCCRKNTTSITYPDCVYVAPVIRHAKRMHHIVIHGLSGSIKFFGVGRKLLNIKYVFDFIYK